MSVISFSTWPISSYINIFEAELWEDELWGERGLLTVWGVTTPGSGRIQRYVDGRGRWCAGVWGFQLVLSPGMLTWCSNSDWLLIFRFRVSTNIQTMISEIACFRIETFSERILRVFLFDPRGLNFRDSRTLGAFRFWCQTNLNILINYTKCCQQHLSK